MALSKQQEAYIREVMEYAEAQLRLRDKLRNLVARWNLNGFSGTATTEEIQAVFPHLTGQIIVGSVTTMNAINTALGDVVSGNATNLIKMKG